MKKQRLLILDACTVIELHAIGLWSRFLQSFEVTLTGGVVAEVESVDLTAEIQAGAVRVVDVTLSEYGEFRRRFDWAYLGEMDPGETESLAFLHTHPTDEYRVCSADHIVFRVLGLLGLAERGVSLESLLKRAGLGRKLPRQYTDEFRNEWTRKGQEDSIRGRGLRRGSGA